MKELRNELSDPEQYTLNSGTPNPENPNPKPQMPQLGGALKAFEKNISK